jgi:hypothetical protein
MHKAYSRWIDCLAEIIDQITREICIDADKIFIRQAFAQVDEVRMQKRLTAAHMNKPDFSETVE